MAMLLTVNMAMCNANCCHSHCEKDLKKCFTSLQEEIKLWTVVEQVEEVGLIKRAADTIFPKRTFPSIPSCLPLLTFFKELSHSSCVV